MQYLKHKARSAQLVSVAASCLLLSATTVQAEQAPQFSELDTNNNEKLEWVELQKGLESKLSKEQLDQQEIMTRFDSDDNGSLKKDEFELLVVDMELEGSVDSSTNTTVDATDSPSDMTQQQTAQANQEMSEEDAQSQALAPVTEPGASDRVTVADIELESEREPSALNPESDTASEADADVASTQSPQQSDELETATAQTAEEVIQPREINEAQASSQIVEEIESQEAPAAGIPMGQTGVTKDENFFAMQLEELEDRNVKNSRGEEIGEVERVVMSKDMRTIGIIVSEGGLLGFGEEEIMIPANEISLVGDDLVWNTSLTEDQIEESTSYDAENYLRVSPRDYPTLNDLETRVDQ